MNVQIYYYGKQESLQINFFKFRFKKMNPILSHKLNTASLLMQIFQIMENPLPLNAPTLFEIQNFQNFFPLIIEEEMYDPFTEFE